MQTTTRTTFAELPNLQLALQKLKLVEQIKEKANINTLMGVSIIRAINENKSDSKVLEFVQSQAKDNAEMMGIIIGSDLTKEILNLNL